MKRSLVSLLAASVLALSLGGAVQAASTKEPTQDGSCALGGSTTYSWSNLRVFQVELDWYNAGDALVQVTFIPIPHKNRPRGSGSWATPSSVVAGGYVNEYFWDTLVSAWFIPRDCL